MENKKYLSLERLTEYDALLKGEINAKDEAMLSSAKQYTDDELISKGYQTAADVQSLINNLAIDYSELVFDTSEIVGSAANINLATVSFL